MEAQQRLAEVVSVPRTHTCMSCQQPIAVHGRLVPCKHAFCLECATEMPKCVICCATIQVVERVAEPLYISSLSQRSYFTEQELQADTRLMFRRLQSVPALYEAYQQYYQKHGQQGQQHRQQQQGGGLPQAPQGQAQQQHMQQQQQQQQQPQARQQLQQHPSGQQQQQLLQQRQQPLQQQ